MIYDANGEPWIAASDVIRRTIASRSAEMEANARKIRAALAEAMYGYGPDDRVRDLRRSAGAPVNDARACGLAASLPALALKEGAAA